MSDHGSTNQLIGCGMSRSDSQSSLSPDIRDMRTCLSQMMKMMEVMIAGQKEFAENLRMDVASIKDQVSEIKALTHHLTQEQITIKSEIQDLKIKNENTEKQIQSLKTEMVKLKLNDSKRTPSSITLESVVNEVKEREDRSKNIIVTGVPELFSRNKFDRKTNDTNEVLKITRMANKQCPEPKKIMRIGKYDPNKNRPIKVYYKTQGTVINLLRNRNNINLTNVKTYSDQTPQQQSYIKTLQNEMLRRCDDGEKDLIIRYRKGVPEIIKL